MKAVKVEGAPGGARTKLSDVLPLDTPLVVQFFPVYGCTFSCNYCHMSIPQKERGFVSNKKVMPIDLFYRCADDLANFPSRMKTVRFVGMGEPLIHPKIKEMVRYTKEVGICDRVEILTNGHLLKHSMSLGLVKAGLDRLVISIQGTSAQKYKEVCGVELNFEKFVENISFLYKNKGDMQIYIKIIDIALDGKEDEDRFYNIFGNICDGINIEHAGPIYPGVDLNKEMSKAKLNQFGLEVEHSKDYVCSQAFFTMQINPDGNVVPCYSIDYPTIVGNCNEESLLSIWNGEKFQEFRRRSLDGADKCCSVCANCNINRHRRFPEDIIDNDVERIRKFYQCLR